MVNNKIQAGIKDHRSAESLRPFSPKYNQL